MQPDQVPTLVTDYLTHNYTTSFFFFFLIFNHVPVKFLTSLMTYFSRCCSAQTSVLGNAPCDIPHAQRNFAFWANYCITIGGYITRLLGPTVYC